MSFYQSQHIPILLKALGLPQFSAAGDHATSDYYWHPYAAVTEVTFGREWQRFQDATDDNMRRVCFLTGQAQSPGVAVLVSFSAAVPQVFILGQYDDDAHPDIKRLIDDLCGAVRRVWPEAPVNIRQLGALSPELVLTAAIQEWLTQGSFPSQVDFTLVATQQSKAMQQLLAEHLQWLQSISTIVVAEALKELQIIIKYEKLHQSRLALSAMSQSSPAEIDSLLAYDRLHKAFIYSQDLPPQQLFDDIPLGVCLALLECPDAAALQLRLQQWSGERLQFHQRWEKDLEKKRQTYLKSWQSYFGYLMQAGANLFCQYSLIGIVSELSKWFIKISTEQLQGTRFIAELAHELPQQLQVSKETLLFGAGLVGGAFGAAATLTSGWYEMLRVLLVASGSEKLRSVFSKVIIDDHHARVTYTMPGPLGALGAADVVILTMVMAESLCFPNTAPIMLRASGAIGGRLALTAFGKNYLLALKDVPANQMTQNQAMQLMMLAIVGQRLGVSLVDSGYLGINKYFSRVEVQQIFCKSARDHRAAGCVISYADSIHHSSFWSSNVDNMRYGCTQEGRYYEAECSVLPITGDLHCGAVENKAVLLLSADNSDSQMNCEVAPQEHDLHDDTSIGNTPKHAEPLRLSYS